MPIWKVVQPVSLIGCVIIFVDILSSSVEFVIFEAPSVIRAIREYEQTIISRSLTVQEWSFIVVAVPGVNDAFPVLFSLFPLSFVVAAFHLAELIDWKSLSLLAR